MTETNSTELTLDGLWMAATEESKKRKRVEECKLIFSRAQQYAVEYETQEKKLTRLKREARLKGGFYVSPRPSSSSSASEGLVLRPGNIARVAENICKFEQKGLMPSQIGVILRDLHGIAQVKKSVTGSKILRILKAHRLAPEIPEDLYHLIKTAVAIRKHLERNRKDKDSKSRLILVESRTRRLACCYNRPRSFPQSINSD